MRTTSAGHARLAELIALKEAIAEMLITTMNAASIRRAQVCEANTEAEFKPFINGSATNAIQPKTGTKPCK